MAEKIVSICMTMFMLVMCMGAGATLNRVLRQQDAGTDSLNTLSAVSPVGAQTEQTKVRVSGDYIISLIRYMKEIDESRKRAGKDTIYEGFKIMSGTGQLTPDNVGSYVSPAKEYTLTCDMKTGKATISEV